MNYSLQITDGKFHGFQRTTWEINDKEINECQFWRDGIFQWSYVMVNTPCKNDFLSFYIENWGTPELTREVAERWAAQDNPNCVIVKRGDGMVGVPYNEDLYINA